MSAIKGIYSNTMTALALPGAEGQVRINAQRALFVRMTDDTGAYVSPGGGTTDESAWTAGASSFSPTGGAFNDSAAALTSGQQGTARATANRALHVNVRDHLGNEATLTGNSLNVNVTNAASGGTALADEAAVTAGSTQFTPAGGVFNDTPIAVLTSGQGGLVRLTNNRAFHVSLRTQGGVELLGQQLMAASIPVTLASNQSALSVTATNAFALDATLAKLTITQGTALGTNTVAMMGASVTTAVPSYTTGQISPLSMNVAGGLRQDLTHINAVAIATGTGIMGTGVQRVAIASDNDPVTVKQATAANLLATVTQGPQGTIAASWRVQVTDLTNTMPTMDAAARKGFVQITDGTNSITVKAASTAAAATDTSLVVSLNPNTIPAVSQSGTWNIGTVTTVTTVSTVTTCGNATASNFNAQVVGSVAAASADSGNPVKVGGVYLSAPGTILTSGNRSNELADGQGRVMVAAVPIAWVVTQATTLTSTVTETTIVTAGAAGIFNDLISLIITNSSATACSVTIKDATGGTTRMIVDIAANGGAVINLPPPGHPQATAAANWTATCGTSVASIHITAICNLWK